MPQRQRSEKAQELVCDGWEILDRSDPPSVDALNLAGAIFTRA